MRKTTRNVLGGVALASALAATLAPASAGASLLATKQTRVVASNAFITSRCEVSLNVYNPITNKRNLGLQGSTAPSVGAPGGGYESFIDCTIYSGSNVVADASSSAAGASTTVNQNIQLTPGAYVLCVAGTSKIQYGNPTSVSGCVNFNF